MNKWVEKSIKLANSKGYLDSLFRVYPVGFETNREISQKLKDRVVSAVKSGDRTELVKTLLELPRFPIDDPYIASLRRHPYLLEKNPKTLKRISDKLLPMKAGTILGLASKSKSPSRQFGNSFEKWLIKINHQFLEWTGFKKCRGTAFLKGSGEQLKQFAVSELGVRGLSRRPDFIMRTGDKFILGEAKFLTDYGGTQNNQLDGALKMAKVDGSNVMGAAVVDGIVWFENNSYMHKKVKESEGTVLSALLLRDFIKSLK